LQKDTVAQGYGKLQKGTEVAKGYWDYYNSKFARKKGDNSIYEVCSKLYRNDAISRKVHIVARLREDKK